MKYNVTNAIQELNSCAYIAGEFIHASETYALYSPLSKDKEDIKQHIIDIANTSLELANVAITQAHDAFINWKKTSPVQRANYLYAIADYMQKNQSILAHVLHLEQGKHLEEAISEIEYSRSYFIWFAQQIQSMHSDILNSPYPHKLMYTLKTPVGVCAAITPFNFPSAMLARKLAPALAAGCTMLIKPATETPLSALMYGIIANAIDLPKGVLSILPANNIQSIEIGKLICQDNRIRKLSFTGSSATGKILMQQCAPTLKRLSLELGGNAACIISDKIDMQCLNTIVKEVIANKFRNMGQTCISINRFFIHKNIYSIFIEQFLLGLKNIQISPLIHQRALDKIQILVNDALNKGAQLLLGGKFKHNLYYEPTILTHVNEDMRIYNEEIFGPVATIMLYENTHEVIEQANSTPYGLAHYAFTHNTAEAHIFKQNLACGMLGLNTASFSSHLFPFGGIKESGFGKEGSIYGLDEYLNIQSICEDMS
jgi:succinate-semialdehyde dehydrogenase / glutarate-semialdehyde dehydrogenase